MPTEAEDDRRFLLAVRLLCGLTLLGIASGAIFGVATEGGFLAAIGGAVVGGIMGGMGAAMIGSWATGC